MADDDSRSSAASEPDGDDGSGGGCLRRGKFWLFAMLIGTVYYAALVAVGAAVASGPGPSGAALATANTGEEIDDDCEDWRGRRELLRGETAFDEETGETRTRAPDRGVRGPRRDWYSGNDDWDYSKRDYSNGDWNSAYHDNDDWAGGYAGDYYYGKSWGSFDANTSNKASKCSKSAKKGKSKSSKETKSDNEQRDQESQTHR